MIACLYLYLQVTQCTLPGWVSCSVNEGHKPTDGIVVKYDVLSTSNFVIAGIPMRMGTLMTNFLWLELNSHDIVLTQSRTVNWLCVCSSSVLRYNGSATTGNRAFPVAAITSLPSLRAFKRALKTELFCRSYGNANYRPQQHWHYSCSVIRDT